jgi:hypothetical protein
VDGREVIVSVVDAPDLEAARRRIFGFVLRGDIGEACGPDGPVILNWRAARAVEVLGTEVEVGTGVEAHAAGDGRGRDGTATAG